MAHDGAMGEKPLTTDEALPRATLVGGGPLGAVAMDDPAPLDPMAAAGSINTTRSNIKNSGAMSAGPAADARKTQEPVLDETTGDGDIVEDLDPMAGGAATDLISTTRANIKNGGAMSAGPAADARKTQEPVLDDTTGDGEIVEDPDPMAGADLINTTRSNIKNSGAMSAGSAADARKTQEPVLDETTGDGDIDEDLDPMAGAGSISTTRSNIKNGGAMSAGPDADARTAQEPVLGAAPRDGEIVDDLDPMAGAAASETIITTRSNIKTSSMTTAPPGSNDAVDGDPIPGLDVKLGKNPGGSISGLPPDLQPTPTRPPDPIREPGTARPGQAAVGNPTGAGAGSAAGDHSEDAGSIAEAGKPIPAGIAIKEQGVKYGEEATGPVDSPGVAAAAATSRLGTTGDAVDRQDKILGTETVGAARAGDPIPGLDVKLGRNPGGVGNTDWRPPPDPGPGPSPDSKPIPGLDDAAEKKKA